MDSGNVNWKHFMLGKICWCICAGIVCEGLGAMRDYFGLGLFWLGLFLNVLDVLNLGFVFDCNIVNTTSTKTKQESAVQFSSNR